MSGHSVGLPPGTSITSALPGSFVVRICRSAKHLAAFASRIIAIARIAGIRARHGTSCRRAPGGKRDTDLRVDDGRLLGRSRAVLCVTSRPATGSALAQAVSCGAQPAAASSHRTAALIGIAIRDNQIRLRSALSHGYDNRLRRTKHTTLSSSATCSVDSEPAARTTFSLSNAPEKHGGSLHPDAAKFKRVRRHFSQTAAILLGIAPFPADFQAFETKGKRWRTSDLLGSGVPGAIVHDRHHVARQQVVGDRAWSPTG